MWARPVQLRLSGYTSETYLAVRAWESATLDACPVHGGVSCGLVGHGYYGRVKPEGILIARFRCPQARKTFSLLPDFLSSHLSGELDEVEAVVLAVEAASSVEAAADRLRPDIELPGAVRWVRRRLGPVRTALLVLVTMLPALIGCAPRLGAVRAWLGSERALVALRALAEGQLQKLRHPLGLRPRELGVRPPGGARQQEMGADPGG